LGIGAALRVESPELDGLGALAPDVKPVSTHPVLSRPRDPHVLVMAVVAYDRNARVEVDTDIARHVTAADLGREQLGRSDEPPVWIGNICVDRVTGRRPTDPAITLPPRHPRRAPRQIGCPHPATLVDPVAVVIGRPAERIARDPQHAVVGVLPVAVRVRNVARLRRAEYPAVRRVVVPGPIWIELIEEHVDAPDGVAGDIHVDRVVAGCIVVDRPLLPLLLLLRWRRLRRRR